MTDSDAVLDAMLTRRSVRSGYSERPVSRETLTRILACGESAPSSKNAQPWRLHVVTDRHRLDTFAELVATADGAESYVPRDPRTGEPHPQYASSVADSAEVLRRVPATIWVENLGAFSVGRATLAGVPAAALAGSLVGYGFELIGIGAAVQNMWIAAVALGLSAAFMGDVVVAEDAIRSSLAFTGDLMGVLALGYSAARPTPSTVTRVFDDLSRVVWH